MSSRGHSSFELDTVGASGPIAADLAGPTTAQGSTGLRYLHP
ncbi:MAG: hypothetical protein ACLVL7_02215 [Anaerotruncus massiliensis (ex Togo et al. 2019)]